MQTLWRAVRALALGLACVVVLVLALGGGAVLHLGTAPARRLVATQLPVLLEGAFPGSIEVHQLGALALGGVGRVDVDLVHPDGGKVATLRGVSVKLDTLRALRSLAHEGPLEVPLQEVSVDSVDVDVSSVAGRFRIVDVFVDPDAPETAEDPAAKGLDLRLERLAVRHIRAHGTIDAGGPVIDAEVDHLLGSLAIDPSATTVGLERAEVLTRQAPRGADLHVRVSAALTIVEAASGSPEGTEPVMSGLVAVGGTVGGTPASVIAMLVGDDVHGVVNVPSLTREQLSALAPEAPPIGATASIAAVVDGTLSQLGGHLVVLSAASRLDVDAEVTLEPMLLASVHVRGSQLDASLVGGPKTSLSFTADAEVEAPSDEDPSGAVHLVTERGTVGDLVLPALVASATFVGDRARGKADIHEPGVQTRVTFAMHPGASGPVIDATVDAPRVELARLHARGVDARGVLTVAARGRVDLGAERVDGTAHVTGEDLASPLVPDSSIGVLELDVRAAGPMLDPEVHASLLARRIRAMGRRVEVATVQADGPALHPVVNAEIVGSDLPRVRARTTVHLEPGIALENTTVEASRGTTTARVRVERVDVGEGTPALRNVVVDGLGERLTLSVLPTPRGGTRVVARAPRLSIPAIAQLAAVETGISRGEIGVDADVALDARGIDGLLLVDLARVDAQQGAMRIRGLRSRVYASFEGKTVAFDLEASSAPLGRVAVSSRRPLELAGPPAEPRSWMDATGQIAVDVDVDLAAVASFVPPAQLPVADVTGRLVLVGHVDREARGGAPTGRIAARTDRLAMVGKPKPTAGRARAGLDPNPPNATLTAAEERTEGRTDRALGPAKPTLLDQERVSTGDAAAGDGGTARRRGRDRTPVPAWTLRGVDVALNASCDEAPQRCSVTAAVSDVMGPIVTADIDAKLPYERLLALGGAAGGGAVDRRWLEETPFSLRVGVPSRTIASLPKTLGIPLVGGRMVGLLRVEGTAREPELQLEVSLVDLTVERTRDEKKFSTKVVARYDGTRAVAHVAIDRETERLLKGKVEGEIAVADILHPPQGRPLPWTASADVALGPLPLEILQIVVPARIEGVANGRVQLTGLNRDAALDAALDVDGLVLGGIPHRTARLELKARDGKLEGLLRLVQPNGALEADADVGITWGAKLAPELRAGKFDVGLRAKNFRVRALEPFVSSVFHQLDGRLDGGVRVSEAAIADALGGGGIQAELAFSQGRIEAAAGGGQLEDVRAKVRLDDEGVLRLEDVFARGQTGEVRAAGFATFGSGTFRTAKLNVVIPSRRPMPLLIEGEHLGDVSGSILAEAGWADGGRQLRVGVDIPRLAVQLPDRMPDGVQKLDDIERARIGTIRNGRFVPLPLDAPDPPAEEGAAAYRTRVDIKLRDASITMGDMLRTRIRGNPTLFLEGGETRMAGSITVQGGRVDIKGRLFEIDSGTITFGADPANPDVILTASWEAPDGTMVYADFAGPLQTGKVTLRSNPARSREEIIALVVFGRVEGLQPGGDQADTSTQAIGAAGGFATQGLNSALDDITSLEVRTRIDTSSSTNPRPELEVQISREVALRIAYLLGEIAPGQSADKTFATLDWNFRPEWSVETTVGDKASSTVDLIWEHLY